jgi:hypothetical protein
MSKKLEMEVVMALTDMDAGFQEGRLMFSPGLQNAGPGHVGSVASPIPVRNIAIDPTLPDPVFDSYPYNDACGAHVRGFLFRIQSEGGEIPSTCKAQLLDVPSPAWYKWKKLSGEITLKYAGVSIFTDPRGIAHVGDYVFGIDYDSPKVPILGKDELRGQSGNYTVDNAPFDLTPWLDGDEDSRGQGIVAVAQKVYPLIISAKLDATEFDYSKVLRLGVSGKDLAYETIALAGKNAQETAPVKDSAGNVQLLIPAAGGPQNGGATNGEESNICLLPALGAWPAFDPLNPALANVLLTGDPASVPEPGYDFHSIAAAFRDENSVVFILTTEYGQDFESLKYRIYQTTVGQLLSLYDNTQANIPTINDAVTAGKLTVVDEDILTNPGSVAYGIYHPAINLIQHPTDVEKDLLVFTTGSHVMVTRALAYGSPTAVDQPDSNPNPYLLIANDGGVSLNSIDFPLESLYEAERDEGSFKRGAHLRRGGGKAGPAAAASDDGDDRDK